MFSKKLNQAVAWAALVGAAGAIGSGAIGSVAYADPVGTMKAAPEWVDGDFKFKVRGRLHYDVMTGDTDLDGAGTDEYYFKNTIRRAHFGVEGQFNKRWKYRAEFVLSPSQSDSSTANATGEVGVDDAYVEWVGKKYSILIGEQNIANPLEERTSSNTIQFNERSSVINAFGYGRLAGVAAITNGANWSVSGGLYGDSLNTSDSAATQDQYAAAARATWAPIMSKTPEGTTLVHLGASARYRDNGDVGTFGYAVRPLNGRFGTSFVGGSPATDTDTSYGVEAAGQFGRFGFQGEYLTLNGETQTGGEYDADGYYVDAFFSLTGEDRSYAGNTGSFGRITPRQAVGEGGPGAWMLGARYDYVDLSDAAFGASRGEQTSWLAGVQWNPVAYVTFKLNYAHSDIDRVAAVDGESDTVSLRTQFDW